MRVDDLNPELHHWPIFNPALNLMLAMAWVLHCKEFVDLNAQNLLREDATRRRECQDLIQFRA